MSIRVFNQIATHCFLLNYVVIGLLQNVINDEIESTRMTNTSYHRTIINKTEITDILFTSVDYENGRLVIRQFENVEVAL